MIYGYVRVSTDRQVTDGASLDAQMSMINGYCMMKGWEGTPEFFVDQGVSGSVPMCDRLLGSQLLATVKAGDTIVVTKLDRAFRSASDALGTLDLLKKQGVSVHMIDLGGDVSNNGVSRLIFTILAAVAEMERGRIAERIRDAKQHLKAEGKYPGGRRPYGYDVVKGTYIPREDEQVVIREIVDLRHLGWGFTRIATHITREGRACFFPTQVQRIIAREMAG